MEKEVQWLQSRIDKLHEPDFDLEAWKSGTIVVLARLFGERSPKIDQIASIRYEQSSWALRDAKGSNTMLASNIRRAEEILRVAIEELGHFGPAESGGGGTGPVFELFSKVLEDELKVSQYRAVADLVRSDLDPQKKKKAFIELLNGYGHDTVPNLLAALFISPQVKAGFQE